MTVHSFSWFFQGSAGLERGKIAPRSLQVTLADQFGVPNGLQVALGEQFGAPNGAQGALGGQFEGPNEFQVARGDHFEAANRVQGPLGLHSKGLLLYFNPCNPGRFQSSAQEASKSSKLSPGGV